MTCRRTTPTGIAPDMLTIEEAARVLRIGRSAAYQLAREYLATDGSSGIPVMRIGGQLRVPRHMLEGYIGGPITWPIPDAPVDDARVDEIPAGTSEAVTLAEPIQLTGRRATRRNGSQLALGLDP